MPPGRFLIKLALLSLLMIAPLAGIVALKWPISSDLLFYAAILKSFSAQLWSGDLYPRWLVNANGGFGAPVFLFYSPLLFYGMSLLEWLSPFDPHGFARVIAGMALALFTAGVTSRRWLSLSLPQPQAEKAALLYAGFPYLLIPIYAFFGLAQLWAAVLFPLLLEAAHRLPQRGWRGMAFFAASYAALALTHLPSLLIFGPIPIFHALAFAQPGKRLFTAALAALSASLGVACAALYMLPAAENKPFIAVQGFLSGKFDYTRSFFELHWWLAVVILLLPLLGFYMELPKPARRLNGQTRFWLAALGALLFMTLPLSRPLWDHIPALHYLQGTFRFFLAMLPGVVFVAAQWLPQIRSRLLYPMFFIVGLPVAALFSAHTFFFDSPSPSARIIADNLIDVPEYQTAWMGSEGIDVHLHMPDALKNMPPVVFVSGSGNASILAQGPRFIRLQAQVDSAEATLALHRFYFPGWQLIIPSATGEGVIIEPRALLTLRVPPGSHDITLTLPWYEGEREGAMISMAALVIVIILGIASRLPRARNRHIKAS